MKQMILAAVMIVALTPGACAWWDTVIDTVETYYPDGQIKERYQQVLYTGNEKTLRTGFYRSWHPNGQLWEEGQYNEGPRVHTWVTYDSTGRKVNETAWVKGEKHGREIRYNPNGTEEAILNYRYGQLHGKCLWRKSTCTINGLYNNPDLEIVAEKFYVDGALLVTIIDKQGGGLRCWEAGEYYNEVLGLWVEYTRQCKEFVVGRKVDGERDGRWTHYDSLGEIMDVEFFQKGKVVGR